jgi:CHAT domain-containing protein/tetratricopeptide (TPR) repeat protein
VAQEFHISVTPLGENQYLVRLERVAPGVPLAEEQVSWPVEDWLLQARQLMNDPLLGVLQGSRVLGEGSFGEDPWLLSEWNEPTRQSSPNLAALGQQLYNALFQGSLRDSWIMAQAIAQNQRAVLRLRLGLKGSRLPRLPWEVLHAGDRPIASGIDIAFSRYQLDRGLMSPVQAFAIQPDQPLRILMAIAGPSDRESLELAQEARHLQEELQNRPPHDAPAIQLTILEQPGREQLTQALEQGRYQVFHYAGHSNLGVSGGDVYLVSSKTGLTETLNGDDLAGLLANNGVQLAVFNSCRGAYTATSDAQVNSGERNLAEALVKRGIPGVLAMAERIPDEVALTLTRLFYRNLNQGYPIDLSLSRARQGLIAAYGANQLYWALPVLYLHQEFDGFLTHGDDAAYNQAKLLILPERSEMVFEPAPEDSDFAPSTTTLMPQDWLDAQEELEADTMAEFPEDRSFEGSEAPEDSDTVAFIQDLLNQLQPEATEEEPTPPAPESDRPATGSEELADTPPPEIAAAVPVAESAPVQPSPSRNEPTGRDTPKSAGTKRWWHNWALLPKPLAILGALGVLVAIALLSFWIVQSRERQAQTPPSIPELPQSPTVGVGDNLREVETSAVTSLAIEQLSQGNVAQGKNAVEELLDRGTLSQADAALSAVPREQLDSPAISFLRGRLAWQLIQTGSDDYAIDDVRRYWETASDRQPNSATYLNALGFAYYAEGDYDRANQAWFDALYRTEEAQVAESGAVDTQNRELLTTYAGLALGLWKSAEGLPADKRASLLNEALKLRQKVLSEAPADFQPDALSQNWLWMPEAIQDWQELLALSR